MDKKNSSLSLHSKINKIVQYTIPKLHEGKTTYVDFYVLDPATDSMRRVKRYFENFKTKREKRQHASEYIEIISAKLREGWNPFVTVEDNRGYTLFDEALERYRKSLASYTRKKTIQSYSSRLKIFNDFISGLGRKPKYIYQFDSALCSDFLDYISLDREASPRTRNNYKGWLSSLAEWLIERRYISQNPTLNIKKLKEKEKIRKALTAQELQSVFNHLKKHDRYFLLACLFEYFTFIRPNELSHVKIGDISLKNMNVYVPGSVSKNRKDGSVSLNPTLVKLMIDLGVLNNPSNYYLFGRYFKPSATRADADQFNKRWTKMRKVLKLPENLKFYSLKDSGIRDLANSKGVVVARDQARHQDIATTNKYLSGRDLKGPEGAREFESDLDI